MRKERANELRQWHAENFNTLFNFREQLRDYCLQDVRILAEAMVEFRRIYQNASCPNDDVLFYCPTLASAAMRQYRLLYLPANTIARIKESGIGNNINQSKIALKMLRWIIHSEKLYSMRFRDNGEHQIVVTVNGKTHTWSVDGFVPEQNLVIKILGDWFHGHYPNCFKDPTQIMPCGRELGEVYKATMKRLDVLQQHGYTVRAIWECEIRQQLKDNAEMKAFFEDERQAGPICLRDAFFG